MKQDGFLAVGSSEPPNAKAELFDFETGEWATVSDYPFSRHSRFFLHEMLFISELTAYIVIGGFDGYDANLATIAQFQNDVWTNVGQLNTARTVSFRALFLFHQ